MIQGYAAYRKAKQAEESQAVQVCAHCKESLPADCRRGRKYCSLQCKSAAWEGNRQPRPKRERAEYHKLYKRNQRAEMAKKEEEKMRKQAWEIWTRVDRPDLVEYRGEVKGLSCELWWDNQVGVTPGWCVRINAGVRHREQDIPVKGRLHSKLETLHRNVLAALR